MKNVFLKFKPHRLAVVAFLIVACPALGQPVKPESKIPGKTFIFHNAIRDLKEFRAYADIAARLKPYGKVEIDIGVLAEKSPMHKLNFRSGWHEYGAYMATMWAFFPHPKLVPHLPADWVIANRKLLLGKVAILKELELGAVFSGNETQFLPESFFRQYPTLRGPRVDSPSRSTRAEFAWCVDQPETLEMIEWMMTELKRNAPQIKEIDSWYNDSGSGVCWSSLYVGRNGPDNCRNVDAGVRIRKLYEAMDRGARKGGGSVQIRMAGNIAPKDRTTIEPLLPPFAKFGETFDRSMVNKSVVVLSTRLTDAYPIKGIIDVQTVLSRVSQLADPEVQVVEINTCQTWYQRTDEPIPTVRRLVDLMEDALRQPAGVQSDTTAKLRELALRWSGEKNADRVVAAFSLIKQQCFAPFDERYWFMDDVVVPGMEVYTAGSRIVTRPLLIKPELLTPAEEAYFLPYVYTVLEDVARLDYNRMNQRRRDRKTGITEYRSPGYRNVHDSALEAANLFEQSADAPEGEWFCQLALSLRLWASTVRSLENFYFGQEIRDRNPQLTAPPRWYQSARTHAMILWNEIQRNEMDNANELRAMLEKGGLDLFAHAADPQHEDYFLYGPDIIGELQKKADLMRTHWLDAQWYLPTEETIGK